MRHETRLINDNKDKLIITDEYDRNVTNIFNNTELRRIIEGLRRTKMSNPKIVKECNNMGFPITLSKLESYLSNRMKLLSPLDAVEIRQSVFEDTATLYTSIDKCVTLLEEKIESWKEGDKDKELLVGIAQLREYQKMALEKLGELKGAIGKVENQYNQTNIIVAQHQTDYLKELVKEGKIEIKDETLRDLIYGRKLDSESKTDIVEESCLAESE